MLTITTDYRLRQMAGALHVQFHTAVLTLLDNHGATALGLPEGLVAPYRSAIEKESDLVNRALGSEHTQRIEQLDQQRDQKLTELFYRLEGARYAAPASAAAEAWPDIQRHILTPYPASIKQANYAAESAKIDGLLLDLDKVGAEALKALGADTIAAELKKLNQNFTQAYLARNAERTDGSLTLDQLRPLTDQAYQAIADQLAALATLAPDTPGLDTAGEALTARQTLARRAIAELSQHVAYYQTHYLGKTGSTAAAADDATGTADATGTDSSADGTSSTDKTPTDVTEVTD